MRKATSLFLAAAFVFAFAIAWTTPSYATAVTASRANDADDLANGSAFDNLGAWTLTVANGQNFTGGAITTTGAGGAFAGTLTLAGSHTGVPNVGTLANSLLAINVGANGSTTTFIGDAFATTYTITGTGTVNSDSITATSLVYSGAGTISVDTAENITAAITTSADNQGVLTLEGATTVTGQIGTSTTADLSIINVGADATTSSFSAAVYANLINITGDATNVTFSGDITSTLDFDAGADPTALTFADGTDLTGAVTNAAANDGRLDFAGTSTVSGQVASDGSALTVINAGANSKTVTFSSDVFATLFNVTGDGNVAMNGTFKGALDFDDTTDGNGTFTLAAGEAITGAVTNAATGEGILVLGSGSSVSGAVGNTGVGLKQITLDGGGATIGGNTKFKNVTLGANTLGITGTLDIPASGTISTTVNGDGFGKITSTGIATTGASVALTVTVNGFVTNGTTGTLIDGGAGGAVAALGSVTSSNPNLTFTQGSSTDDLTFTITRNTTAASSGNSTAVATTINGFTEAGDDMANVLNALDSLTSASAVDAAYSQLDPVVDGSVTQGTFAATNASLGTYTSHLGNIRAGVNGGDTTGYSTGDSWKNGAWWGKGYGNHISQNSRSGVNGYTSTTGGANTGVDAMIDDHTRLGIGGGYGYTDVGSKGDASGTIVSSYQGTLYSSYDMDPYYIDGAFSFTWNSYNGSRPIDFPGVSRTAKASYDGQQYTGLIDGGYVYKTQGYEITPLGSVLYSHISIDKYTESEAADLNLIVNSQSYDALQTGLGLKVAYPFTSKGIDGKLVPEIHVKWLYDFVGDKAQTTSAFTGGGASFKTNGLAPAKSSFNLGASLTFLTNGNLTVTGDYDLEAKTGFTSHSGSVTVRVAY